MNNEKKDAPRMPPLSSYLWIMALSALVGFAAVYLTLGSAGNGLWFGDQQDKLNNGAMTSFVYNSASPPAPDIEFLGKGGVKKTLSDFKGKVVLLNVWATWCGPCKEEMPSLDRLQAKLGGDGFEVVALSLDRGGLEAVQKFFDTLGVKNLALYVEPTSRAMTPLGVEGMPTTILVNAQNREVGRLVGPAAWDSPEAIRLISGVMDGTDK